MHRAKVSACRAQGGANFLANYGFKLSLGIKICNETAGFSKMENPAV